MTRPISRQRQRQRHIAARWETWLPRALTHARANFPQDPQREVEWLRQRHMEISTAVILAGLPWSTVKAHLLDDPLADEFERAQRVREAIARREARMGRVKGRRKTATRSNDGR